MFPKIPLAVVLAILGSAPSLAASASSTSVQALVTQYSLTTSTSMPFPSSTSTSSDTQSFIVSNWSLSKGKIQNGPNDLAFVSDPFPSSPAPGSSSSTTSNSTPVLQVTYPAGSYSHDTGGTQLYSLWNTSDGSVFQSMMLSYEVAFDSDFNWVMGGKLPGMRGGPNPNGCSGGSQPNGTDCFSTRLMWRTDGAGEVYAYLPPSNNLCSNQDIICNSDYGISFNRGAFTFASGQWSHITLLVQMNNPPDIANGNLMMFFNDVPVTSQKSLQFRTGTDVNIGGLYLSTFFGGSDSSWATPNTTHTYFRNFQLWGSDSPSTLSGSKASAASGQVSWSWTACILAAIFTFIL